MACHPRQIQPCGHRSRLTTVQIRRRLGCDPWLYHMLWTCPLHASQSRWLLATEKWHIFSRSIKSVVLPWTKAPVLNSNHGVSSHEFSQDYLSLFFSCALGLTCATAQTPKHRPLYRWLDLPESHIHTWIVILLQPYVCILRVFFFYIYILNC